MTGKSKAAPHRLSVAQRRALVMLADAGLSGCTEALLRAHGFTAATIAGPVRAGIATATAEGLRAGGKTIEVTRFRITEAGRRAVSN